MSDYLSAERIDWLWRVSIAQSLNIFLFFSSLVTLSIPFSGTTRPYFILMIIFYWSINRPSLLHPIFIFAMGILYDLILNFPLGIHALLFLALQWGLKNQRLYFTGQNYTIFWVGFGILAIVVMGVEWLVFGLLTQGWILIAPILSSWLLTVVLFPIITLLFALTHRILPS